LWGNWAFIQDLAVQASNDLAFRAQLIIPEQRILFDYWQAKRGKRAMPSRGDIEPMEFVPLLPLVSLMDVMGTEPSYRVRLAGTALREAFGRETTGLDLEDLYEGRERTYWSAALSRLVTRRRPAQGVIPVRSPGGAPSLLQFWLRLPLSADGRRVDMILGYDSFQTAQKAQTLSTEFAERQAEPAERMPIRKRGA
jgi:hypothetical protein